VKWGDIPGLKDYISFALTVFSLGLAVLAIVYSMYSNSSLTTSLNLLESSSKKLSNTSDSLTNVTQDLHKSVSDIPESLDRVHGEMTKTRDVVSQLSGGIQIPVRTQNDSEQRVEYVDEILSKLPPYGIAIVTIFVLANQNHFKIDHSIHMKSFSHLDLSYFHGVYVTLKAAGIIDGIRNDGGYTCTYYHSSLNIAKLKVINDEVTEKAFDGDSEWLVEARELYKNLLEQKI
jgi:hypothetical protein